MSLNFIDQFYRLDPAAPPASGTALTFDRFEITAQNNDGQVNEWNGDAIYGVDIVDSYRGDRIVVEWPDGSQEEIRGSTFYLQDSRVLFTPVDGTILQDATFIRTVGLGWAPSTSISGFGPVCFTKGTRILTEEGEVAVEALEVGSRVVTAEGASRPLKRVLSSTFGAAALRRNPKLCPIRIEAGALGGGLPRRDLWVSRQHRMLVRSLVAERMFGRTEVLVPAIKLTTLSGIQVDTSPEEVTYVHLLFEAHEVIYAEGAPTESLLATPRSLSSVGAEARKELLTLFPKLLESAKDPARLIPPQERQKRLVMRHRKNGIPLLASV